MIIKTSKLKPSYNYKNISTHTTIINQTGIIGKVSQMDYLHADLSEGL
jgi:hypothetical protein